MYDLDSFNGNQGNKLLNVINLGIDKSKSTY